MKKTIGAVRERERESYNLKKMKFVYLIIYHTFITLDGNIVIQ